MSKSCFVLTVTRPVQASPTTMFAGGSNSKIRTVFDLFLIVFTPFFLLRVGWHACCNTRVGDGGEGCSGTAWSLPARLLVTRSTPVPL